MEEINDQIDMLQAKVLDSNNIGSKDFKIDPFVMVIFGGTGDLSQRKLIPALYHLFREEGFIKDFAILGLGSRELTDDGYREMIKAALQEFAPRAFSEDGFNKFAKHLFYKRKNILEEDFKDLCTRISELQAAYTHQSSNVLFYLAVQPNLLNPIIDKLQAVRICDSVARSKIIIEKPFGHDKPSAYELNQKLLKGFKENQIYRIDHYLGKDTVQSISFFRFGNSIFEPLWNRRYIDHVQITAAEDIGIGSRARFYEQTGVIRDFIQNHVMQLIALIAMEPPVGFEADFIRDEKVKVLRTIRPMTEEMIKAHTLIGQYGSGDINGEKVAGYREEKDVPPDSVTPTFFAGKFFIDNWRWSGVPFYVRAGKRLAHQVTEISIRFKQPPLKLLGKQTENLDPNSLIFSIHPKQEITLRLNVKYPGFGNKPHGVHLEFNYDKSLKTKTHSPYERLLIDSIMGDLTLFARQDGIEAMWSVVDPIIKYWEEHPPGDLPNYPAGTWGPEAAQEFLGDEGRCWQCTKD